MKRLLRIIVLVLILVKNPFSQIHGFYLLDNTLEEGVLMMNSSVIQSDMLNNYCQSCKWGITLLRYYLRIGETEEKILNIGTSLCISLKLQTPRVCKSGVHLFGAEIIKVARKIDMSAAEVCYFILDDYCEEVAEYPKHMWNVSFSPFPKPKVQEILVPNENAPKLRVLHISDTHVDPLYVEGSNAMCGEPLCCRESDGHTNQSFSAAGKWGHYRCDLPKRTLENLLDHISQTHKNIDYLIWTGDLVQHDVWNQTNDSIMDIIEDTIRLVSEKLPGVQVFPALGNHERAPANCFPTIEQDNTISSFYEDIDTLWSRWLPVNVSSTLRRGAFYSVLARPGLRIISLNMNACGTMNFWLLENSTDPSTELQWLINELQLAEIADEKVHIIGHIPPGYQDCLKMWSHNYYEVIARFESTVTAQFFGHTHFDEIEVFYHPDDLSRATNIAYIGPSVTPYWNLNPGYRIYYVDGDHSKTTRLVVDHETWILDLEEANLIDNPVWRKSYSARDAYSMEGLRPTDWNNFINGMKNDDDLFNAYFKNYWKNSPFQPECSSECKGDILCQAKSGRSHDKKHLCEDLNAITDRDDRSPEIPQIVYSYNAQTIHKLSTICTWFFILTTFLTFSV